MNFDQNNPVVKLCARGMELEATPMEALALFNEAWGIAANDVEKFTAAHYIARHQDSVNDKLKWDETALNHALQITEDSVKAILPSLYLNIGKCYEDLTNTDAALASYEAAHSFVRYLPYDGYGNMIRAGVQAGIDRTTKNQQKII